MALLDLLGRRWALRVLWELGGGGVPSFRELQARCGHISSSVLNERLRELRAAGVVEDGVARGYRLTTEGRSLLAALAPMETWSRQWSERRRREQLERAADSGPRERA